MWVRNPTQGTIFPIFITPMTQRNQTVGHVTALLIESVEGFCRIPAGGVITAGVFGEVSGFSRCTTLGAQ